MRRILLALTALVLVGGTWIARETLLFPSLDLSDLRDFTPIQLLAEPYYVHPEQNGFRRPPTLATDQNEIEHIRQLILSAEREGRVAVHTPALPMYRLTFISSDETEWKIDIGQHVSMMTYDHGYRMSRYSEDELSEIHAAIETAINGAETSPD